MPLLEQAMDILEKLVGFDTTSRSSNLPLIDWMEEYLGDFPQLKHERLGNPEGTRATLLVTLGPAGKPGIVFSGHTDVVPVDNQKWSSNPFQLTLHGSRLYGRGTADMKGFLACCLAMIPAWSQLPLARPVHFAFSFDEEIGCREAARIGKYIKQKQWDPLLVLIGEPTQMQPVAAHKGIYSYLTTVTGRESHSSQTQNGANAIHYASKLIVKLEELSKDCQKNIDKRFTPPYTTIQAGTIHGGTARNIIPRQCEFEWEIRPLPSDDPPQAMEKFMGFQEALDSELKKISPDCGIVTRPVSRVLSLKPETDEALVHLMLRLAESNEMQAVAYGTEGGIMQAEGLPCFVCGPGSIGQAHIPDEYIEISQLERCLQFLRRIETELLVEPS